jgi:mono/diheme cytochrome c family protein
MTDRGQKLGSGPLAAAVFGLAGAVAAAGLVALSASRPAGALSSYAQQTGLSCGRCHTNPAGGGKLTAFGSEYAANDHKVPAKKTDSGKKQDSEKQESSKEGDSKEGNSKEQVSEGVTSPTATTIDLESGRALDYVPWTLRDPYHSHFLYKSDDYRD